MPRPIGFTGNPLARLSEKRSDSVWLNQLYADEKARYLLLWRGSPLLRPEGKKSSLCWLGREALQELSKTKNPEPILLGLENDIPHFAIDVSAWSETAEGAPFADLGAYVVLRAAGFQLGASDLSIAGQALWLLNWHRKNLYSPETGAPMMMKDGGTKRVDNLGTEYFPRINPVVIVLVEHDDHCLLARGPHFPQGFYSALAGYVEAGESLEECAQREIMEEANISLSNLRYHASQPWPLSDSMMIGFFAETNTKDVVLDAAELEAHVWVSKQQAKDILAGTDTSGIFLPPGFTIAGTLIRHWAST